MDIIIFIKSLSKL